MKFGEAARVSFVVAVLAIGAWSWAELIPLSRARSGAAALSASAPKLVSGDYIFESPEPLQPNHPMRVEQIRLEVDGQKIVSGRNILTADGRDDQSTFFGEWARGDASIVLLHQKLSDYHVFWVLQSTGETWSGTGLLPKIGTT